MPKSYDVTLTNEDLKIVMYALGLLAEQVRTGQTLPKKLNELCVTIKPPTKLSYEAILETHDKFILSRKPHND